MEYKGEKIQKLQQSINYPIKQLVSVADNMYVIIVKTIGDINPNKAYSLNLQNLQSPQYKEIKDSKDQLINAFGVVQYPKNQQSPNKIIAALFAEKTIYLYDPFKQVVLDTIQSKDYIISLFHWEKTGLIYLDSSFKLIFVSNQNQYIQLPMLKQDRLLQQTYFIKNIQTTSITSVNLINDKIFISYNYPNLSALVYNIGGKLEKLFGYLHYQQNLLNPNPNLIQKLQNSLDESADYYNQYYIQEMKVETKDQYIVKYYLNLVEVYYKGSLLYEIVEDSLIVHLSFTVLTPYNWLIMSKQNQYISVRYLQSGIQTKLLYQTNGLITGGLLSKDEQIYISYGIKSISCKQFNLKHLKLFIFSFIQENIMIWDLTTMKATYLKTDATIQDQQIIQPIIIQFLQYYFIQRIKRVIISDDNSIIVLQYDTLIQIKYLDIQTQSLTLIGSHSISKTQNIINYTKLDYKNQYVIASIMNISRVETDLVSIYYDVNLKKISVAQPLTISNLLRNILLQTNLMIAIIFDSENTYNFSFFNYEKNKQILCTASYPFESISVMDQTRLLLFSKIEAQIFNINNSNSCIFQKYYQLNLSSNGFNKGDQITQIYFQRTYQSINSLIGITSKQTAFWLQIFSNLFNFVQVNLESSELLMTGQIANNNSILMVNKTDNSVFSAELFNQDVYQVFSNSNFKSQNISNVYYISLQNMIVVTQEQVTIVHRKNTNTVKSLKDNTFGNPLYCVQNSKYFAILYANLTHSQVVIYLKQNSLIYLKILQKATKISNLLFLPYDENILFVTYDQKKIIQSFNISSDTSEAYSTYLSLYIIQSIGSIENDQSESNFLYLYTKSNIIKLKSEQLYEKPQFSSQPLITTSKLSVVYQINSYDLNNQQNDTQFLSFQLDPYHKLIWLSDNYGNLSIVSAKTSLIVFQFKKTLTLNQIFINTQITQTKAIFCDKETCLIFSKKEDLSDVQNDQANESISIQEEIEFKSQQNENSKIIIEQASFKSISYRTYYGIKKLVYHELSQKYIVCYGTLNIDIYNSEGQHTQTINDYFDKYDYCQNVFIDQFYNQLHIFGQALYRIMDLTQFIHKVSYQKIQNMQRSFRSIVVDNQQQQQNEFESIQDLKIKTNNQVNIYLATQDEILLKYSTQENRYRTASYINKLENIYNFNEHALLAQSKNSLVILPKVEGSFQPKIYEFQEISQVLINKQQILIVFKKVYVSLLDLDLEHSSLQIRFNQIFTESIITHAAFQDNLILLIDILNNMYEVNAIDKSIIKTIPSTSTIQLPQYIEKVFFINSFHQLICFLSSTQEVVLLTRKNNSQMLLRIDHTITNVIDGQYGDLKDIQFDDKYRIIYLVYDRVARARIYQISSNYRELTFIKQLYFPSHENSIKLKRISNTKLLALITPFHIAIYTDYTFEFVQQFRSSQGFSSSSIFFLSVTQSNSNDLLINQDLSQTKHFFSICTKTQMVLYSYNSSDQQNFKFIKALSQNSPKILSMNYDGLQDKIEIIIYSKQNILSTTIAVSQLQLFQFQQKMCQETLSSLKYIQIQKVFREIEESNKYQQLQIADYQFVIDDPNLNDFNIFWPSFKYQYTLNITSKDQQSKPLFDLQKEFLSNLQAQNLIIQGRTIFTSSKQVIIFNDKKQMKKLKSLIIKDCIFEYNNGDNKLILIVQNMDKFLVSQSKLITQIAIQDKPLLNITNVSQVSIDDFTTTNFTIEAPALISVFGSMNSIVNFKQLNFSKINVKGDTLLVFMQLKNLTITDSAIEENYFQNEKNTLNRVPRSLVFINGNHRTSFNNLNMTYNANLNLIYVDSQITKQDFILNKIIQPKQISYLKGNTFEISNSLIKNNTQTIHNKNLIDLQTSFVIIKDSIIENNIIQVENQETSLISVKQAHSFVIENSQFLNNEADNGGSVYAFQSILKVQDSLFSYNKANRFGGAFYLYDLQDYMNFEDYQKLHENMINNCTFNNNTASISGGAIHSIKSSFNLTNSTVSNNYAPIGGGIRYLEVKPEFLIPKQLNNNNQRLLEINQNKFVQNTALFFGQNIGSYPSIVKVNNAVVKDKFRQEMFRSSSKMNNLIISIYDEEGQPIYFDPDFEYLQNDDCLKSLKEKFAIVRSPSQHILLADDIYVPYEKGFYNFTNLKVTGEPGSVSSFELDLPSIKVYDPKSKLISNLGPIGIEIEFRNCQQGEILVPVCNMCSIQACQICEEGSYSLVQPNSGNPGTCLPCIFEKAESCYKNEIVLKKQYWRKNSNTDEILYCHNSPQNCEGDESTQYCSKGFYGPLCEQCDIRGQLWQTKYASVPNREGQCWECSESIKITTESLVMISLFALYILFTIYKIIMKTNVHTYATYLLKFGLAPIGRSGQAELFSLYAKMLMNFVQLSLCIRQMQISLPVQIYALSGIIGDPITTSFYSLDCLLSSNQLGSYLVSMPLVFKRILLIHVVALSYFLGIIIVYLIVTHCLKLLTFQIKHIYATALMFFIIMHTGVSSSIFQTLACRKIGSDSYMQSELTEPCWSQTHFKYTIAVTLPVFLFWIVLIPLLILFILRRAYVYGNLNSLKIIQRYSYLFFEYRNQTCYWEFVKISLRASIQFIMVYFKNYQIEQGLFSIFIMLFYLYLSNTIKPYTYSFINKIDQISSFLMLVIFILALFQIKLANDLTKTFILWVMYFVQLGFVFYMLAQMLLSFNAQTSEQIDMVRRKLVKIFPCLQKRIAYVEKDKWKKFKYWQILRVNVYIWIQMRKRVNSYEWKNQEQKKFTNPRLLIFELNMLKKSFASGFEYKSDQNEGQQNEQQSDNNQFEEISFSQINNTQTNPNISQGHINQLNTENIRNDSHMEMESSSQKTDLLNANNHNESTYQTNQNAIELMSLRELKLGINSFARYNVNQNKQTTAKQLNKFSGINTNHFNEIKTNDMQISGEIQTQQELFSIDDQIIDEQTNQNGEKIIKQQEFQSMVNK